MSCPPEATALAYVDAELDAHVRATMITVHHPIGTCKMGAADDADARRFRADIAAAGLEACLHVVPHVDDPFLYYALFDVLAMVSREKAYCDSMRRVATASPEAS